MPRSFFLHYPESEHRHLLKSSSAGGMGVEGRLEIQTPSSIATKYDSGSCLGPFFSIIQEVNTGIC